MTIPKGQCNQTSNDNKLHNFFLQFSKLKQAFINNCICNAYTCILDIKSWFAYKKQTDVTNLNMILSYEIVDLHRFYIYTRLYQVKCSKLQRNDKKYSMIQHQSLKQNCHYDIIEPEISYVFVYKNLFQLRNVIRSEYLPYCDLTQLVLMCFCYVIRVRGGGKRLFWTADVLLFKFEVHENRNWVYFGTQTMETI